MNLDRKWIFGIVISIIVSAGFALILDYQNDLETQQYREANARYEKALTGVNENYDVKLTKNNEGLWINQHFQSAGDTAEFVETGIISDVKPANQIDSFEPQSEETINGINYKVHISDGLSITDTRK